MPESGGGDGDREALEESRRGVKPLPDRGRVVERARRAPSVRRGQPESVRFELLEREPGLAGLAPGIDRGHLRRLRRGEVEPDREVDLHGLRRETARRRVREALASALDRGERCVLVIHGRGRHSSEAPVLRSALPEWLAEPPHGPRVMCFASAPAQRGGATYVLLRRTR
ncbi:MAG: Smr/MutS family protein [Myxococcota bacterium]|nr:Smr/MutS family protein [Myxococcota bacterium]